MASCCVLSCKNNTHLQKKYNLSFHRFPLNPELRKIWLDNISRPSWTPLVKSVICSDHYNQYSFSAIKARIPLGYTGEAMKRSEELGIQEEKLQLEKTDLVKIYANIVGLLRKCSPRHNGENMPPLFTLPDEITPARNFLDQLHAYTDPDHDSFEVYDVSQLFYQINRMLSIQRNDVGLPTAVLALNQLLVDTFQYSIGLSCTKMHESTEKFTQCSLSKAMRMCFVICDFCCPVAGIDLIPGRHVPLGVNPQGSSAVGSSICDAMESLSIASSDSHSSKNTIKTYEHDVPTSSGTRSEGYDMPGPSKTTSEDIPVPDVPSETTREVSPRNRASIERAAPSGSRRVWNTPVQESNTESTTVPSEDLFPSLNESNQRRRGKGRGRVAGGAWRQM